MGGSVAEWLACWTQARKGPSSNRSRDAVGTRVTVLGKLFTPIVHQAAKLVADCQEPGSAPEPYAR